MAWLGRAASVLPLRATARTVRVAARTSSSSDAPVGSRTSAAPRASELSRAAPRSACGQFTWNGFEALLNPACASPRLDFAYSDASYDSPAPPKNPRADRIVRMDFTKLGASKTITLVNPLPTVLQDGGNGDDD